MRKDLYDVRVVVAASSVKTFSDCQGGGQLQEDVTRMNGRTMSCFSYSTGTELLERIFSYMRGCVKDGSSSSLCPLCPQSEKHKLGDPLPIPATVYEQVHNDVLSHCTLNQPSRK